MTINVIDNLAPSCLYTNTRADLKQQFLHKYGFDQYIVTPLPIDASARQYARLSYLDKNFILMDCPPEYSSLTPFIRVCENLIQHNLSAPIIYNEDHANGFLILEDLGTVSINQLLATGSATLEEHIYKKIIRVLTSIQNITPATITPHHTTDILIEKAALFVDWFLPILDNTEPAEHIRQEYCEIWQKILAAVNLDWQCFTLRDFHVDNLMYIAERQDIRKIGILDFQDASMSSPVYDLVSLLQDARREIKPEFASHMINYYLDINQYNRKEFLALYAVLGAQRALRILGVFARKAAQDKNYKYLSYVPLVRKYLTKNLMHPLLAPLQQLLQKYIR